MTNIITAVMLIVISMPRTMFFLCRSIFDPVFSPKVDDFAGP